MNFKVQSNFGVRRIDDRALVKMNTDSFRKVRDLSLTDVQATAIQHIFWSTGGWDELAEHWPKFAAAIDALPDIEPLTHCNSIFHEMIFDAIDWIPDDYK